MRLRVRLLVLLVFVLLLALPATASAQKSKALSKVLGRTTQTTAKLSADKLAPGTHIVKLPSGASAKVTVRPNTRADITVSLGKQGKTVKHATIRLSQPVTIEPQGLKGVARLVGRTKVSSIVLTQQGNNLQAKIEGTTKIAKVLPIKIPNRVPGVRLSSHVDSLMQQGSTGVPLSKSLQQYLGANTRIRGEVVSQLTSRSNANRPLSVKLGFDAGVNKGTLKFANSNLTLTRGKTTLAQLNGSGILNVLALTQELAP